MLVYDKNNKKLINTLNMQDILVLISRLESDITIIETKPKKFKIFNLVIDYTILQSLCNRFKLEFLSKDTKNIILNKIKSEYCSNKQCSKYCDNPFNCMNFIESIKIEPPELVNTGMLLSSLNYNVELENKNE